MMFKCDYLLTEPHPAVCVKQGSARSIPAMSEGF